MTDIRNANNNLPPIAEKVQAALARAAIRTTINSKAAYDAAAAKLKGLAQRGDVPDADASYARSQDFSDLASYRSVIKTRQLTDRFGFSDPFYRSFDKCSGAYVEAEGKTYVNFASYDYLGLSSHPHVVASAKAAIDQYGTSVSASRIVAGNRPIHCHLESELAALYGTEAALTFVSGHATNVTTIGTVLDGDDAIFCDELVHNSVHVGATLSKAQIFTFRHNDLGSLEFLLRQHRSNFRNVLIAVEGLYSMDGDVPDLPSLIALKQRYGCWLMVDEAHALGVLGDRGCGSAEYHAIDTKDVDIWMGTLSKTLAGCGGYIAGSEALITILKYRAAGQVYSVGMAPAVAGAALAALDVFKAEPERVKRVRENGQLFLEEARRHGLDTCTSEGFSIVPVMVGDTIAAGKLTDRMFASGINVMPIIYPAVPLKAARLRFFITVNHSSDDIRRAVSITAEQLRKIR
ncbi:MAG: aminotransferase class I/II-fold pyridoxal phosphate-dependent enzyme [Hyphomicrobium sp.]|uniref:aminotransferase class I/II-fold pyridoxal phosphate-dependent enzyme n=1 Tax=Hyphomicrobium sp. TaxID=82 RepID=UPI0039E5DB70